jgi:dTMP kinase
MLMAIAGGKCRPGPLYSSAVPLITFEGIEGSGKSTQARLAAERLRAAGRPVRTTREPGGTPIAEAIRAVLMDTANAALDPMAEWLLIEAARRQHVVEILRPALAEGVFLLCDRFADSTEAYQAAGRGLDAGMIGGLDAKVRDGIAPDLTLLYDLDPREGLARAKRRDAGPGRFESAALEFHERVRAGFLAIARREPGRVAVVSVEGDAETVFARTWRIVEERFGP